jgi:hypothetical protein
MSQKIEIDPEFQALLPALTKSQKETLEALIVAEGCKDAITVWNGLLADGHNRYEICTRLGLHYRTNHIDLPDRDAVMLWMMDNQGGRRNLSDIDSISIAQKREEIIARRAKENEKAGGGDKVSADARAGLAKSPNPVQPIHTRAEAAKAAGVGEKKYAEGKVILNAVKTGEAPAELLEKVRSGEVSIHKAATEIKEARKPAEEPRPPQAEYTATETETVRQQVEKESDNLWLLKSTWRKTGKKDRASFMEWMQIAK